jgi:hypothetical protein
MIKLHPPYNNLAGGYRLVLQFVNYSVLYDNLKNWGIFGPKYSS